MIPNPPQESSVMSSSIFHIPTVTPVSDELSESVLVRLILIDHQPTEPSKPRKHLSLNWAIATRGGSARKLGADLLAACRYGRKRCDSGECRGYWIVTGEVS